MKFFIVELVIEKTLILEWIFNVLIPCVSPSVRRPPLLAPSNIQSSMVRLFNNPLPEEDVLINNALLPLVGPA